MKPYITSILLFLFSSISAQTTINARIITDKGKEPVPYATVVVKNNSSIGISSDAEGWFILRCNENDSLIVRCIGFKTNLISAADALSKKVIELTEDRIMLGEISISAESAFQMLLRARDSTNKYQMKSFQGTCLRQDRLSFNGNTQRKSDAVITFKTKEIKNGHIETDYWLKDLKLESFSKISELPYFAYPTTIPLNISSIRMPLKDELSEIKCTITTSSDDKMIIKYIREKPTKNMVNEGSYTINKETWIIEVTDLKGNFRLKPLKKWNRYHFETNVKFTNTIVDDSCVLGNFTYRTVFSHKKIDPQNLWEYQVNMDITPQSSDIALPEGRKLLKVDYLLFKKSSDNIQPK